MHYCICWYSFETSEDREANYQVLVNPNSNHNFNINPNFDPDFDPKKEYYMCYCFVEVFIAIILSR